MFVPSREGARQILSNDFVDFSKGYVKSMADCVGHNSLLCVSQQSHSRIRRLLSLPFSMPSLAIFILDFDRTLSQNLHTLAQTAQPFSVLDLGMKVININYWGKYYLFPLIVTIFFEKCTCLP